MLAGLIPLVGPYRTLNLIEAGLWTVIGVGVAVAVLRRRLPRGLGLTLAIALIAFGASDVVEVRTGAWWHPWWMLLWKAACVVVIVGCVTIFVRGQRAETTASPPP